MTFKTLWRHSAFPTKYVSDRMILLAERLSHFCIADVPTLSRGHSSVDRVMSRILKRIFYRLGTEGRPSGRFYVDP